MSGRVWSLFFAVVAMVAWVASAGLRPVVGQSPSGAASPEQSEDYENPGSTRKVPCEQVISRIDRQQRRQQGQPADMSQVAKHLGTRVVWVEHCMLAYGRRPKRPGYESAETREQRLEAMEEDEPEESGPEDEEEPGARERVVLPDKPRVLHIKPPPTPSSFPRD